MKSLFLEAVKQDKTKRAKPTVAGTRYDFAPGESPGKGYFCLWPRGVKEKQARRWSVWTNIDGLMDMGEKGFLYGSALKLYEDRKVRSQQA